ncbi:hypothetical protein G5I_00666 [Acromyrmex echinatior]|uniref:Secreted protein n=1 Tax=Acromyrmex echinatior TaxID=103372 RepID=F4W5G9_ACREC|nr:hypothetical protein G5I_00666 [Acromyrmex echinatior]
MDRYRGSFPLRSLLFLFYPSLQMTWKNAKEDEEEEVEEEAKEEEKRCKYLTHNGRGQWSVKERSFICIRIYAVDGKLSTTTGFSHEYSNTPGREAVMA